MRLHPQPEQQRRRPCRTDQDRYRARNAKRDPLAQRPLRSLSATGSGGGRRKEEAQARQHPQGYRAGGRQSRSRAQTHRPAA